MAAIDGAGYHDVDMLDWHLLFFSHNLYEFNAARCDTRKEDFGRSDFFARAAILHGSIYEKLVMAGTATDSSEDIGRLSLDDIGTRLTLIHVGALRSRHFVISN